MGKGNKIVNEVQELVKPFSKQLSLEIWDIQYIKEGKDWFLRVFIDKPGGITIEDCENLSRLIDNPLDNLTVFNESYCLEVSSPGLERKLVKKRHFEKFIGASVKVKTIKSVNNKKIFSGVLKSYDEDGSFSIIDGNDEVFVFDKKNVSFVKLDDFGGR